MTLHAGQILDAIADRAPPDAGLLLPPPCLLDMQAEPLTYEDGISLSIRFPVLPRYRNPMGNMQGGFIAAALDNTIGPFSYLVAPPSVTSQLDLSYLRPVTGDCAWLDCTARLTQRTRRTLYIDAEACAPDGKAMVLARAVCQIL